MKTKTTLSIIIPVYNEAKRVSFALDALLAWKLPRDFAVEKVIFVDDGSTDDTVKQIKKTKKAIQAKLHAQMQVISYKPNHGAGYAVKRGMALSSSDYTLFFDVDMAVPLSEFAKFVPLMRERKDVIIGTRKNAKSQVLVHQPRYREIFGQTYTYMTNIILNTWVGDFNCGFKMFSKEAKEKIFARVFSHGWGFHAETVYLASRLSLSLAEVPVIWIDKKGSKVNIFVDAPRSFKELVMIRFKHAIIRNTAFLAKYTFASK